MQATHHRTKLRFLPVVILLLAASAVARAEFGDIVLNNVSEQEGMRPVIFQHWFHRIRFQCRVCHNELKFEMRVGATQVTMDQISQGRFCGACHNGEIAWTVENCDLCHTGKPGLTTRIQGSHQTKGPGIW
jgi:c(7)-type cytochrome triheme protein